MSYSLPVLVLPVRVGIKMSESGQGEAVEVLPWRLNLTTLPRRVTHRKVGDPRGWPSMLPVLVLPVRVAERPRQLLLPVPVLPVRAAERTHQPLSSAWVRPVLVGVCAAPKLFIHPARLKHVTQQ